VRVALHGGQHSLDVHGESNYQDNLWRIVGGRQPDRVQAEVIAVLKAETGNAYDPNAVSVWIGGLLVGYIPRQLAPAYHAGVIVLEGREGMPIALHGRVVGGGTRADGPGQLGVFLQHDPTDFGVAQHGIYSGEVYEGESGALGSHHLGWLATLPADPVSAIRKLRQLLGTLDDCIERHYLYLELEQRVYRIGLQVPTALAEFDAVCSSHDSEMDRILPALITEFNLIPHLRTYHQMAIRLAKAHDWHLVSQWANRGLELYGSRAGSIEWPADLQKRLAGAQAKISGSS
jgi:hypothetical protein